MKKILYLSTLILITLCFSGCWGRGWLMPYSFQPSYHKFKKMCKLNELPLQERYTKTMEFLNNDTSKLHTYKFMNKTNGSFPVFNFSDRLRMNIHVTFKDNKPKEFVLDNVDEIEFWVKLYTKRSYLSLGRISYKLEWNEKKVDCFDIYQYIPLNDYTERIK